MASYWSFAVGTALLVGAHWFVRRHPAPRTATSYNEDIAWI